MAQTRDFLIGSRAGDNKKGNGVGQKDRVLLEVGIKTAMNVFNRGSLNILNTALTYAGNGVLDKVAGYRVNNKDSIKKGETCLHNILYKIVFLS